MPVPTHSLTHTYTHTIAHTPEAYTAFICIRIYLVLMRRTG